MNQQRKKSTIRNVEKIDLQDLPALLTVKEVADIFRVAPLTIKRWDKRGKLSSIRINSRGDRRFHSHQVLKVLRGE